MKEFEKWFNTDKLIDNLNTNYTNNVCSGLTWDTIIEVSEYVWKESLRWVLSYDELCCERLKEIIRKELNVQQ